MLPDDHDDEYASILEGHLATVHNWKTDHGSPVDFQQLKSELRGKLSSVALACALRKVRVGVRQTDIDGTLRSAVDACKDGGNLVLVRGPEEPLYEENRSRQYRRVEGFQPLNLLTPP